ncbi:MAG: hypothetical protein K0U84_16715 [Actinomycetia bacterium]|nr:hypothetical protein [Actinomycetes bacterium]
MRNKRTIYLTAILATAPAAAAVILGAFITTPPDVQYSARPHVNVPGIPNVDVKVPNLNGVTNAVPNIPVPNINMPNVNVPKVNPGHVGAPGRGR